MPRSLWTLQPIYCNACGTKYETDFQCGYPNGKHVCSRECFEEMRRRDTLSMLGQEYRPLWEEEKRDASLLDGDEHPVLRGSDDLD